MAGAAVALHGKSSEPTAARPVYQDSTDECALISGPVLAKYAPGAVCKRSPSASMAHDEVIHTPSWTVDSATRAAGIQVDLRISSNASKIYASTRASLLDAAGQQLNSPMSAEVNPTDLAPLAQEAFLISGASRSITGRADGRLVVRSGNATATVTFTDYGNVGAAEATVKAIAADVIANLR